ncbi:hypothetical protein BP6252_01606 [Coleophoma cylindrospora]|uniref:N-acetyltransferase domain-containing protein n=1 Tax=Coleophoma cylindrospora TaxID=1849047 RepID=A0A3D8STJ7_9HELO|nr:hypothetical protein BP6252_01606 [Coleophoma cylindrospora]
MASENSPRFYIFSQEEALSTFLPLLHPHLPQSNPLYNRLQAPQNLPSRHCLFAATFPPSPSPPPSSLQESHTLVFADRSRHAESQIWTFNPLISEHAAKGSVATEQQATIRSHLLALILFFKSTAIPDAPGWPFSPILKFGCIHDLLTQELRALALPRQAVLHDTQWNLWLAPTRASPFLVQKRALPDGFSVVRVPEDQLDIVLSTSSIPRQKETMLTLPNISILNATDRLAAWAYIGIDGTLATLYVLEEYRGLGLASFVAKELLTRLGRGDFGDVGFKGESGWCHSDVYDGNKGSEAVMRAIGGSVGGVSSYFWVDSELF